jgi:hypothetical protein
MNQNIMENCIKLSPFNDTIKHKLVFTYFRGVQLPLPNATDFSGS